MDLASNNLALHLQIASLMVLDVFQGFVKYLHSVQQIMIVLLLKLVIMEFAEIFVLE